MSVIQHYARILNTSPLRSLSLRRATRALAAQHAYNVPEGSACTDGIVTLTLRLVSVGDSPSGSQQAFPDPFRRSDTTDPRGRFNSRPVLVTHSEDAFRSLSSGRSSASARNWLLCFHGHIIWEYKKDATLYFVYGQLNRVLLECTQQLGVMTQQKTPKLVEASNGANNNPAVSARMLRNTYILAREAAPVKGEMEMANVLKKDLQLQVIHLLVEGNSIRSIERLTRVQKKTIGRLLIRVGNACQSLLDERMRDLSLRHVQVDEIWTYVQKKEARIPEAEKSYRIGDQFVYVALDQDTKLIASYAVGKRSAELTRRFMVDLRGRLVTGSVLRNDGTPIVQLSTDGFAPYPEAVDLAFGPNVRYGSIVKEFRNANRPYVPSEIVGSKRRAIFNLEGRERSICTSHVERSNLTIRTFIRRFTRLTLGFSKKLENLGAAVALHVAHYNFCRVHSTIRKTPAMAAGVTNDIWTLAELVEKALQCE